MKRQALMILTSLSLLVMLTATSVYAQVSNVQVANIPFEFVIGNRAFAAGEYTFTYRFTNVIEIRSQDRGESMFVSTGPVEAKKTPNESKLVFNRYGDQYFLSKVWTSGNDTGRELFEPRAERELIRARSALAKSASEPQMVSVVIVGNKH